MSQQHRISALHLRPHTVVLQVLPGGKGETTTQGLDGLADRCKAYKCGGRPSGERGGRGAYSIASCVRDTTECVGSSLNQRSGRRCPTRQGHAPCMYSSHAASFPCGGPRRKQGAKFAKWRAGVWSRSSRKETRIKQHSQHRQEVAVHTHGQPTQLQLQHKSIPAEQPSCCPGAESAGTLWLSPTSSDQDR